MPFTCCLRGHYNPVKHGLVTSPFDHKDSSLHQFAEEGYYSRDWRNMEPDGFDGDFGK